MSIDSIVTSLLISVATVLAAARLPFWFGQFKEFAGGLPPRPDVHSFIHNPSTKPGDPEMPPYLLDRLVEMYNQVVGNLKDLDTKSNALLGFLGGGIGLFALLSAGPDKPLLHPTGVLVVAIGALFVALAAALGCLQWRRRRGMPRLIDFTGAANAPDAEATKARVALYASILYDDRMFSIRKINISKAFYLEYAQGFFILGVFSLLINSIAARDHIESFTIRCPNLFAGATISCTITKGQ